MQLKNNTITELHVPFDGLDYNNKGISIHKHNSHSLEEYIQYFNIPLMCFDTNEKCQRYYCIECVITSTPYCENPIIGAISNNDLLKLGMSSHKYGSWVETLNPMNSYNKIKKENNITFSNDFLKTKFLLIWNQVHLGRDRGAQVWTRLAHLRITSVNFKNTRKNDD